MYRLLILLLLPLSAAAAAAIPEKNIVDYFLMLPDSALAPTSFYYDLPEGCFTAAKRQKWLDYYAKWGDMPRPSGEQAYISMGPFAIQKIDTGRPYLELTYESENYTAEVTYWKEKRGTILIGVIVMSTDAFYMRSDDLRFYRYDGHTLTKVENLIPRLPISAFVSPGDLQEDSIPADLLTPTLHYAFPEHGGGIACAADMAFWHREDTIYPQELPFINLTDSQIHNARLRLSDDGFKLVPTPAHPPLVITDYFLMLPDSAFAGTETWRMVPDSFLTIQKRRAWVDFYVNNNRETMNDSMYEEYFSSVFDCTVEVIDTFYGYMTIQCMASGQYIPTAVITYWKEKNGTVLIGIGLSLGEEYTSIDEVRFYRYDGHALRKADNMIPKLPVSAFISAEHLKKDGIPADTYLDVHCTLPTEGKDISCFIDPAYDVTAMGDAPTVYYDPLLEHLKPEHIHVATLRLTDKGFQLVKK